MDRLLVLCLLSLIASCGTTASNKASAPTQGNVVQPGPVDRPSVPPEAFGPTDSSQDFQAPWSVRQTKLADNRWLISMRKRMFAMGGDGEPTALLHVHAQTLALQQGYGEYVILSWAEGVQSDMPIAYRWARGEILLRAALPRMPGS